MNTRDAAVSFVCASAMAVAASVLLRLAHHPGAWSRMDQLADLAVTDFCFYIFVPAIVLAMLARRRVPSTATALAVSIGWLALLVAVRAAHPIRFYGELPWWMFRRDFLEVLPIPLALALAFSLATRPGSRSKTSRAL